MTVYNNTKVGRADYECGAFSRSLLFAACPGVELTLNTLVFYGRKSYKLVNRTHVSVATKTKYKSTSNQRCDTIRKNHVP